ncbi:MAG: NAD kinase [Prolixibacteraceae bacterium]|nr:NAD kinase [Prolixibacteraceae bacterium]
MKIAIFGNKLKDSHLPIYQRILSFFSQNNTELIFSKSVKGSLDKKFGTAIKNYKSFDKQIEPDVDLLISIGGDGTFLSTVAYSLANNTPIAGINCGRLGFLAAISNENLEQALHQLINGEYKIENRSLLEVTSPKDLFNGNNYALNELTVHKLDNSSMIQIETYINDEFLANYWADGLIIGTPTGSTAYSLSVGGPIIMPDLSGLIITPIAPHNLTVRPIVVPDDAHILLKISGRGSKYMASFDHRSTPLDFSKTIEVKKAPVSVPVVKLDGQSFYSTLRNKLMWGIDRRN